MAHENESLINSPQPSRRLFLKAGAVAAGLLALDAGSSLNLPSRNKQYLLDGKGAGTLSVALPGLLAPNVMQQTSPFHSVWSLYGDALLLQPYGGKYDEAKTAAYAAEEIEKVLRARRCGQLILNGVSMGGNAGVDALQLLHANRTLEELSVQSNALLLDTPSSGGSVASRYDYVTWLADYPSGRLLNTLPKLNGVDESFAISQVEAITDRRVPQAGSLNFLNKLVYWESLRGGNFVDAAQSINEWKTTVEPSKFAQVSVDMEHVAFEQNRELSYDTLLTVYKGLREA